MNTHVGSARARLSIVIVSAIAGWCSVAVHAQNAAEPASVTVPYSAQEANTASGAKQLYRRLQAASRAVCRSYESRELARLALYSRCYQHALRDAVAHVNLANLREIHTEHNPVRVAANVAAAKPVDGRE